MRRPIIGQFPPASWYWNQIQTRENYAQLPVTPFTSGYNRVQAGLAVAGQLRLGDLGNPASGIDVIMSGAFTDGLTINGLVGSEANPFRIAGTGPIGTATKGWASVNLNDHVYFYGISDSQPMIVNAAGSGQNGVNFIAQAGGVTYGMENVVFLNTASSAIQMNSASAAGSYRSFTGKGIRCFGAGRENYYFGNTSTDFAVFDSIYLEDILGVDAQWDPIQIGHCNDLYLNRGTFINGGIANQSAQNHLVQIVDTNGIIKNQIFYGAPRIYNLATHGLTFEGCTFIYSSSTERGFVGRTDNLSYYGDSPRFNGMPIHHTGCRFIALPGAITSQIIAVQERIANFTFEDCDFSTETSTTAGISSVVLDQRVAGFSNTIQATIGANGNRNATMTLPTFKNLTATDYENHGLLTSQEYLQLHQGFRTL